MSNITYSFKATGILVSILDKIFKSNIHVDGLEHIVSKPTMYVVNHFTRMETFLLPYVLYKHRQEMTHSLADSSLFTGKLGDYLRSLGAISTKEPFRNRKIIQELMMGHHNWVIFPEGLMVKNKKIFHKGKYVLDNPERRGPPHTGAAVLALKAEIYKRNYLNACKREDLECMEYYQKRYHFSSPEDLCFKDIVVCPVNITYYPLRPDENFLTTLVNYFVKDMPERIEEELKLEGKLLLSNTDINIYFGKTISLHHYLDTLMPLTQVFLRFLDEEKRSNLILSVQKRKLTRNFMNEIYTKVAVNIDHVFSSCLRYIPRDKVLEEDLYNMIYIVSKKIQTLEQRRLHPTLRKAMLKMMSDEIYQPAENIFELAQKEEAIVREGEQFKIFHNSLRKDFPFHKVRLKSLINVLANEIEPLKHVIAEIKAVTTYSGEKLRDRSAKLLIEEDAASFEKDYKKYYDKEFSKDKDIGKPFLLQSKKSPVGILLCHGYLSAPEEMRPLAEYLHKQGYTVYVVRVKGHGTSPAQLKDVKKEGWIASVDRGYAILKRICQHVILGGFSAGGLLSLLAAANKQKGVKGVFCINAALQLNDIKARFVPSVMLWNELLESFHIDKGRLDYVDNVSENPDVNYSRNYLAGVRELDRLISQCKSRLSHVIAPTLIVQADQDPVVNPKSADTIYNNIHADQKRLIHVQADHHIIVRGPGSENVFEKIDEFVKEVIIETDTAASEY